MNVRLAGILAIGVLLVGLLLGATLFWFSSVTPTSETALNSGTETRPGQPWFSDKTLQTTVQFTCRNGEEADQYTILESLGSGVGLLDYDGDGLLDVFLAGGGSFSGPTKQDITGSACRLYRNRGNWQFEDVSRAVGLERSWFYNHGVAVADYDCDGWPDLLVTGYGQIALFHNERTPDGGRRFVEVTKRLELHDNAWATSAGWGDLDGDGYPDLYVCHYLDWSFANNPHCKGQRADVARDVCAPQQFKPLRHSLFRNEKGKRFRDVSVEQKFQAAGCGLGVVIVDVNHDGKPDIYVANDASNNFLFVNREGRLEEKGLVAGVAVDEEGNYDGSMGIDAADYDGSHRPALWVTNYQGEIHGLYRNLGGESFLHQTRAAGLASIGTNFVGFGTAFLDFDNDGWEDLVVVNGHVLRFPSLGSPVKQRPVLFHNVDQEGRRRFKEVSAHGGAFFQTPARGRGLALGDLDNDGWSDLVITHTNSPVVFLRNEGAGAVSTPTSWIGMRLVGKKHRDVIGSTIVCTVGNRTMTRFVKGGGSYLSAHDTRILFGLGKHDPREKVQIRVHWSWGQTQTWDNLEPGRYWELREQETEPKALTLPH